MTADVTSSWHIFTGEYPPQPGGVSDYTALIAAGLTDDGCHVDIWCPKGAEQPDEAPDEQVHRMPLAFGIRGLFALNRALHQWALPRILLVQYVYNAFGWRGMNVPFCLWLLLRRFWHGDDVRVMFHEPYFSFGRQTLRRNVLALVTHVMAALLLIAGKTIYISIPAWEPLLRPWNLLGRRMTWLPIPSTVPGIQRPRPSNRAAGVVVGHFGTFGGPIRSGLLAALTALMNSSPRIQLRLIGNGSQQFSEELIAAAPSSHMRVTATGRISSDAAAAEIRQCDVMVQPYPDGVSSRRTSVMACLANAAPVVTTIGSLSEPDWAESRAVQLVPAEETESLVATVTQLLNDAVERDRLAAAGWTWYRQRFALERTIATLLDRPDGSISADENGALEPDELPTDYEAIAR
jgi:glycosyltransferase involved in cell wall biosynthesis